MATFYNKQNGVKVSVTEAKEITTIITEYGEITVTPGNFIAEFEDGSKVGIHAHDLNNYYSKTKKKKAE